MDDTVKDEIVELALAPTDDAADVRYALSQPALEDFGTADAPKPGPYRPQAIAAALYLAECSGRAITGNDEFRVKTMPHNMVVAACEALVGKYRRLCKDVPGYKKKYADMVAEYPDSAYPFGEAWDVMVAGPLELMVVYWHVYKTLQWMYQHMPTEEAKIVRPLMAELGKLGGELDALMIADLDHFCLMAACMWPHNMRAATAPSFQEWWLDGRIERRYAELHPPEPQPVEESRHAA